MVAIIRYGIDCEGTVQGVGFRYFVYQTARRVGLTGFVRNLDNGHVEIEAQGPEDVLAFFLERLRKGNGYSSIDHWSIRQLDVRSQEHEFEVVF